jgi:hypothetical protein
MQAEYTMLQNEEMLGKWKLLKKILTAAYNGILSVKNDCQFDISKDSGGLK